MSKDRKTHSVFAFHRRIIYVHASHARHTDTSFEEVVVVVALKNSAGELRGAGPAMQSDSMSISSQPAERTRIKEKKNRKKKKRIIIIFCWNVESWPADPPPSSDDSI